MLGVPTCTTRFDQDGVRALLRSLAEFYGMGPPGEECQGGPIKKGRGGDTPFFQTDFRHRFL